MIDRPDFVGKSVVITGSGKGLGFNMARAFAGAGAAVTIAEIDPQAGKAAADRLMDEGYDATFNELDVTDPAASTALVQATVARCGALDVWVNNAGIAHKGPAEELAIEQWDASIAVMLSGAFYCCQAAGATMLSRGSGVIVNVASVNGFQAVDGRVSYCTAKAGLVMLTKALGAEWASRGVRVVGIAPAVVLTDMVRNGLAEGTARMETYERRTPMRRLGMQEEVSDAALFLASNEASYIVAETMRVDGGWGAYSYF